MPEFILFRNPKCVVRTHNCGRMFSATNTVFIACPGAESVALELEIIKSVLEQRNLEPYIALENYDPAKDVFCEKICSKIIESKLCIVLLTDPLLPEGYKAPNPNVYYEYGLMTAFGKHIIPLQRKDHVLAFNVRSLDTIKYDNFTLKRTFEKVLQDTLEEVLDDSKKSVVTGESIRALSLYMELQGYAKTGSNIVHGTPFKHFGKHSGSDNKYGLVIRNEGDIPNMRTSLTLIASRLKNNLNNKKLKLEKLYWDANNSQKAGSPQNMREVDRAIEKMQSEIDGIEKYTEFVIICANNLEIQRKIKQDASDLIESMNWKISIYSLDELMKSNQILSD